MFRFFVWLESSHVSTLVIELQRLGVDWNDYALFRHYLIDSQSIVSFTGSRLALLLHLVAVVSLALAFGLCSGRMVTMMSFCNKSPFTNQIIAVWCFPCLAFGKNCFVARFVAWTQVHRRNSEAWSRAPSRWHCRLQMCLTWVCYRYCGTRPSSVGVLVVPWSLY